MNSNKISFKGCNPSPLSSYLKALGIFRIIYEQLDPEALAWWEDDIFYISSQNSKDNIINFFLFNYTPTPIIAPWNGGSGFYLKDTSKKKGLELLSKAEADRFIPYRNVINKAKKILLELKIDKAPSDKNKKAKEDIIILLRNILEDNEVNWLDVVATITQEDIKYPPLVGTGGNDGRLEFTNNFMQRIVSLFDTLTGKPKKNTDILLKSSLFNIPIASLPKVVIGQFSPFLAGGPNGTIGFTSKDITSCNPWDYILMLEGAITFSSAVTKRIGSGGIGRMSSPFTVSFSVAGFGSASYFEVDKFRAEQWMPIWEKPTKFKELYTLFSEGRANVGRKNAQYGVDFARAVATLGVDRGISSFIRYGYLERNGRAYLAIPFGRFTVERKIEVALLDDLDIWIDRLRKTVRDKKIPNRFKRELKRIEDTILEICRGSTTSKWQELIISLGEAEYLFSKSKKISKDKNLLPISNLSPKWLKQVNDGSIEFRLASALASIRDERVGSLRRHMIPIKEDKRRAWFDFDKGLPNVVWHKGALIDSMINVLKIRMHLVKKENLEYLPINGKIKVSIEDINCFIDKNVDDEKIERLLWGLNGINWDKAYEEDYESDELTEIFPPYGMIKLVHYHDKLPINEKKKLYVNVPVDPSIILKAKAGDFNTAIKRAYKRLIGVNLYPKFQEGCVSADISRRIAASILFPISKEDIKRLIKLILKPIYDEED